MNDLKLFTDGSVNPKLNIGFGAYLLIEESLVYSADLSKKVKVKKFENTSSTKLELQTLLWALTELDDFHSKIIVYTDCQNILGLENRRERFEKNDYLTKKNKLIANHELYQEFYRMTDKLNCTFVKIKGHKVSHQKDEIDKIFTLVDKISRENLRKNS